MVESHDYDAPWTEEQWERFMRHSEVRTAKLRELRETLRDHPNCEQIIRREMGWREDLAQTGASEPAGVEMPEDDARQQDTAEGESCGSDPFEDLNSIEAYSAAFAWSVQVDEVLELCLGEQDHEDDDDSSQAMSSLDIAAKIARGDGIGYEDDELTGNIACCKQALVAADKTLVSLRNLGARRLLPREPLDYLLTEGKRVRELVELRIQALRSRVWWE